MSVKETVTRMGVVKIGLMLTHIQLGTKRGSSKMCLLRCGLLKEGVFRRTCSNVSRVPHTLLAAHD
jgi:hypothetical protein